MTITAYVATWLGVDEYDITFDDGLTPPRMIAATVDGPGQLVVEFDKDMNFLLEPGETITRILFPAAWLITDTVGSDEVVVVQVDKINEKEVRLYTNFMEVTDYEVHISGIKDAEGNLLNPSYDTLPFAGVAPLYPSNNDFHTFMGLYAGMQEDEQNQILPDLDPPEVQNFTPPHGSTQQDRNSVIEFDLVDDESGIDADTIMIYIEGALAYNGFLDSFYAPFAGGLNTKTIIPYGFHFVFDKQQSPAKFDSYKEVEVRVVCYDNPWVGAPNPLDTTLSFRVEDYQAPQITSQSPLGTGVNENTPISFRLTDTGESGVDQSLIDVLVNGMAAISGGAFQPGWNGTGSSIIVNAFGGYDIVIDKEDPWATYEWYTVNVTARDNENNLLTSAWTFQSRDWLGPLVVPVDPVAGQTNVVVESHIIVDIYDERGVKNDSILIRFDDGGGFITAFQQGVGFAGGFNGPNSSFTPITGGYRLVIDLQSDLDYGTTYYVEVTALDPDDNPERLS